MMIGCPGSSVITWLLNSVDEKVSASVMSLKTAEEAYDTLNEIIPMSKIFLVMLICMKSYSYCNRIVALYLSTTLT